MIPKIQSSLGNVRLQAKSNQAQQTNYRIKNRNIADTVSFGSKSEIMSETTEKMVGRVVEILEEKATQFLKEFTEFKKNKESELGIIGVVNLGKGESVLISQDKKIRFCADSHDEFGTLDKHFKDYSIYAKNEIGLERQFHIKGNRIEFFQHNDKQFSLNDEVQKYLKVFLPEE